MKSLYDLLFSTASGLGGAMLSTIGVNESITITVGAIVFLCGLVWRAAVRLTQIEERLNQFQQQLKSLKCLKDDCDR